MSHRRLHWLEKFQVQLATAAALAVGYFAAWQLLRPGDPRGPVVFLADGNPAGYFLLLGLVVVLAAAAALVTVSARPEGPLLAALVGAAAVSIRSAPVLTLLWAREGRLGALYAQLLVESLLLLPIVLAAAAAVDLVRWAVGRFRPRWIWKRPAGPDDRPETHVPRAPLLLDPILRAFGRKTAQGTKRPFAVSREDLMRGLACLLLTLVLAVVLLTLLLRSPDRGQILFALFASFALAAGIAHQFFPTRSSLVAWCAPTLAAVAYYALAINATDGAAGEWMDLQNYSYALPIDWLTAGAGGAVLGHWVSARIHEARHFEKSESKKE